MAGKINQNKRTRVCASSISNKNYYLPKRSQVTLFVIAGILIILLVVAIFLLRKEISPTTPGRISTNPEFFISSCLEDDFEETLTTLSSQGGSYENKLSLTYNDVNVSYLCYNQNNYQRCVNQEPFLLKHLKDEIHSNMENKIENCFNELENNLREEGYEVNSNSNLIFEVVLVSGRVILNIQKEIIITKDDKTSRIENFEIIKQTNFYDTALVVQEIVSQETKYCNFDSTGFPLIYPQYDIEKMRLGDGTTIYSVKDKKTNEEFVFAVRSCVIPPGIG